MEKNVEPNGRGDLKCSPIAKGDNKVLTEERTGVGGRCGERSISALRAQRLFLGRRWERHSD